MKAYDLGGKRGRVNQSELASALGWYEQTLRDVEKGRIDITPEQYQECIIELERLKSVQREMVAA